MKIISLVKLTYIILEKIQEFLSEENMKLVRILVPALIG